MLLAALLCALPPGRAFALEIERLARFAPSSGKISYLEVAAGSAIVRFKTGSSSAAAAAGLEASGFSMLGSFDRFNWSAVGLPAGMGVAAGLQVLKNMPQVEWAEPNPVYRAKRIPI